LVFSGFANSLRTHVGLPVAERCSRHLAPIPVYASAPAAMPFRPEISGLLDAAMPFIYFQF
jgi:hypothetical protein